MLALVLDAASHPAVLPVHRLSPYLACEDFGRVEQPFRVCADLQGHILLPYHMRRRRAKADGPSSLEGDGSCHDRVDTLA